MGVFQCVRIVNYVKGLYPASIFCSHRKIHPFEASSAMSSLSREDFFFELPPELIAQEPANPRDSSRLLHLKKDSGQVSHHIFRDLPEILKDDVCLVVNDSKVIRARSSNIKC